MRILAILLLCLCTTACYQTRYSDPLTESAVVEDTFFVPTSHDSFPTVDLDGNISVHETVTPQKFGVRFRCPHGSFVIEGSTSRHAELWKKMIKGAPVTIHYREVYWVTKKGTNFHDFDFIDASPIALGEL